MKALRNLLGAAKPLDLEIGGLPVSCSMSPGALQPWPKTISGLAREQDGPDWIPSVIVDCKWGEGTCRLFVEVTYWTTGNYLHDLCLRVRTDKREVIFVNVANEIERTEDGGLATLGVRFYVTKRKTHVAVGLAERLNAGMRDVLRETNPKLPILGESTAELCDIEVPSGDVLPSAEIAFRRCLQLALLKLDFIDRRRIAERGKPLVDLSRWLSSEQLLANIDDDDEPDEPPDTTQRQYWAGGFTEPPRLEKFLAGNYWKVGWKRDGDDPAAKRTWRRFAQVHVGDYFAIKGYGGAHDLGIHYVGEVTAIDPEQGRLELRQLELPLYKGKAPKKRGAGNWQDTLVPVTRPDVINLLFGVSPDETVNVNGLSAPALDLPLNLIFFGPPGTGKTYHLTRELMGHFQRVPSAMESLEALASELSWFDVTAIALESMGRAKASRLQEHPLVKAKYAVHQVKNLGARLRAVLQSYTVESSKTVNYAKRAAVQYFNKAENGEWYIEEELPSELRTVAKQLKSPPNPKALDDFSFITFHQAYGYEDFIEGIRPNVDEAIDEEDVSLSYRLEDGAFMKAVKAALRLAGFKGTLHEFCTLSRQEREAQFVNARPYAVFIDEINRGNVARIFGELITLLEEDKRLGEDNEVIVQLPYSKKRFGVPPNVHVIGTMNTADRSIEALDTALRRRFEFRELPPEPERLQFTIEGDIDPEKMLRAINRRLEKLYDRDHCIGHAYLIALEDEPTLERLKHVFKHKLIPLLQEYFFGDWGKIGLVLGRDFVRRRDTSGTPFAEFEHDDHDALAERPCWELVDVSQLSSFSFRRIYEQVADA